MTSYAKDSTTGKPLFRDADAPDIKQDPQEAADYAAEVGNMIVGSTAYIAGYPYQRKGLSAYDTTENILKRHNGTGFKPAEPRYGLTAQGTSSTGTVTVAHGLGVIPSAVIITDKSNGTGADSTRKIGYVGANSTTFTVVVWNGGSPLAGNPVEFFWVAYP
uniref:hypothetical protein n=1 Tax=Microbacterium proteolyticum TaxID=1572644 RepID=UPI002417ECA0|nr:hypothetical protein [Microbacterium proteolyticum]